MPFYNFSNHPSAQWPAEQRAAAAELCGDDQIIDIPPGEVPPEWDRRAVYSRARELVAALPTEYNLHAMVATEPTLTYALVDELKDDDYCVQAYAATTRRESVEEVQPDGSVKKTNVFKFVRFREY